jgi:hypothetical protein
MVPLWSQSLHRWQSSAVAGGFSIDLCRYALAVGPEARPDHVLPHYGWVSFWSAAAGKGGD